MDTPTNATPPEKSTKSLWIVHHKSLIIIVIVLIALALGDSLFIWKTNLFEPSAMSNESCLMRGGKIVTEHCGTNGCVNTCAMPYVDGGNDCSSSSECRGRCLSDKIDFSDSVPPEEITQGHCEPSNFLENCQYYYELLGNGKIRQIGSCML